MMCKSEVPAMTAVIYARYSSDNQREESIEGQIRECTAYAEKNGITVVKHYILMLPLCYRVSKLLSDFVGGFIIHFPRLKGLYQMKR